MNNFIASWNYNDGNALSGAPFSLPSLGMPIATQTPPEIRVEVTNYFTINTGAPGQFLRENYHFSDSAHWIVGKHEIAFGGDFLRMKVDLNKFFPAGRPVPVPRYTVQRRSPRQTFWSACSTDSSRAAASTLRAAATSAALFIQDNIRIGEKPDRQSRSALGSVPALHR